MEGFPWWTDEQKRFEEEVNEFVKEIMPRDEETRWRREFPWDIFDKIAERGYTGAGIPKEYGGLGLGATGACIATEALSRMPGVGRTFLANMLGGLRQVIEFGTEEQKRRFLPRIAKGELGAIVITEPFAGTDASAIETTARREGNHYILNGKKRFIVSAGLANRYMVYAKTSDDPEDRRNYRHLTGFIVEKGMVGFSVEKINEITGFENVQNGVLNFDDVKVPLENRIGEEGQGWRVMTSGLNFERTLICSQAVGWLREILRNVVPYAQRRVQFGRPTIEFINNQFKISDLIMQFHIGRVLTYYTAYLWDLGWDITIDSNVSKIFLCEGALRAAIDSIQVMGGDGLTTFYPLSAIMNVAKIENIAGGTMEACRLVIFRTALRQMADEFKMPRKVIHKELGVPVSIFEPIQKQRHLDEEMLLKFLAEDYRINPGLYVSRDDIKEYYDINDSKLDELLVSLEKKGFIKLYRDKKGISLAKATYEGLKKANPSEYYRWFPNWIEGKNIF
jgi:alkylation response protein AidB-like acyl-CoA dehydrogenase